MVIFCSKGHKDGTYVRLQARIIISLMLRQSALFSTIKHYFFTAFSTKQILKLRDLHLKIYV